MMSKMVKIHMKKHGKSERDSWKDDFARESRAINI